MAETAHAIVVGNEKGGTGKSTTCMHIVVALLVAGKRVGSIDLDARQGTLTRYLENRRATAERLQMDLPMPDHRTVHATGDEQQDQQALIAALTELAYDTDYVVMDCPGFDSPLSRFAHNFADTLVTPLNDSFVDMDNLADIEPGTFDVRKPSRYADMVWGERKRRMLRDRGSIDWLVVRNRLSHLDARNKRRVGEALETLAPRIGFRVGPGLSERVIYRELFLDGLTLLDVTNKLSGVEVTMSHVAARQELRALIDALNLEAGNEDGKAGALAPETA